MCTLKTFVVYVQNRKPQDGGSAGVQFAALTVERLGRVRKRVAEYEFER